MKKLVLTIALVSQSAFGYVPDQIAELSLKQVGQSALAFALSTQIQEEKHPFYLKGEFPTKIQSTMVPALVGVGKMFGKDDEATAFTTASVINIIGQIYLDFPELRNQGPVAEIPKVISEGVKTFSRYQDGSTYNFYPPLMIENGIKVHRPINMTLFPIWHGFTNIPNDSDTSSAVATALLFDMKIANKKPQISEAVLKEISTYRDLNRNPMFYNKMEGRKQTGAFMTWLFDEKDKNMPRFYFATSKEGTRIPFNKNDVDCVVNANILKMLALGQRTIEGQDKACAMLNDMIAKDENASCGVYYPNTYNLAYAMAGAQRAGDKCLTQESKSRLISKIISEQNADGSWHNLRNMWQDEVLSTAYAMSALLELGDTRQPLVYNALVYGTHFLIKSAKKSNGYIYWQEDNFFTATAIARSLIMWRSKAYTNSIIASVLLKIDRLYPNQKVKNYRMLKMAEY